MAPLRQVEQADPIFHLRLFILSMLLTELSPTLAQKLENPAQGYIFDSSIFQSGGVTVAIDRAGILRH